MANNRMFLIHQPTGLAIIIGKHMGWGWYNPPEQDTLQAFYARVEDESGNEAEMEDFCLGMESCEADTQLVRTDLSLYHYDEKDKRFLQINKK